MESLCLAECKRICITPERVAYICTRLFEQHLKRWREQMSFLAQSRIKQNELQPGPRGIPGTIGDRGFQGAKGYRGEPGIRGLPGIHGGRGLQGRKGQQGEQGMRGEKGKSTEIKIDLVNVFLTNF